MWNSYSCQTFFGFFARIGISHCINEQVASILTFVIVPVSGASLAQVQNAQNAQNAQAMMRVRPGKINREIHIGA